MSLHLLKHLRANFFFMVANLPMRGQWRIVLYKLGGVKVLGSQHFIGKGVKFDTVYPDQIKIHNHVHITAGVRLLTHYLDTSIDGIHWKHEGIIEICSGAFIGTCSIITKPCRIGENSIVAAGSVVTKDIPDNEIWGGNPARFIKSR